MGNLNYNLKLIPLTISLTCILKHSQFISLKPWDLICFNGKEKKHVCLYCSENIPSKNFYFFHKQILGIDCSSEIGMKNKNI